MFYIKYFRAAFWSFRTCKSIQGCSDGLFIALLFIKVNRLSIKFELVKGVVYWNIYGWTARPETVFPALSHRRLSSHCTCKLWNCTAIILWRCVQNRQLLQLEVREGAQKRTNYNHLSSGYRTVSLTCKIRNSERNGFVFDNIEYQ